MLLINKTYLMHLTNKKKKKKKILGNSYAILVLNLSTLEWHPKTGKKSLVMDSLDRILIPSSFKKKFLGVAGFRVSGRVGI